MAYTAGRHTRGDEIRVDVGRQQEALSDPAPGQRRQRANRGEYPPAARCRGQRTRLSQQPQERAHCVVACAQSGAQRGLGRPVVFRYQLLDGIQSAGHRRPGRDLFDRDPHRSRVQGRLPLLQRLQLGERTRPSPNAAISSTRSNARAIAVPVERVGGRRNRSNSENRAPSGTSSNDTNATESLGSARRTARATVMCKRRSAAARASDTCRASTLAPGSSTRLRRSHATAWLNSATGPSGCVHARP